MHVVRSNDPCNKIMQGTITGEMDEVVQNKRLEENIKLWTGLDFNNSQRATEDRQRWWDIVVNVAVAAL